MEQTEVVPGHRWPGRHVMDRTVRIEGACLGKTRQLAQTTDGGSKVSPIVYSRAHWAADPLEDDDRASPARA